MRTEILKSVDEIRDDAAHLYRLAFLLTGRQEASIDIAADAAVSEDDANPSFTGWMRDWQRRLVIARALTAVDEELRDSARRTQLARPDGSAKPPRNWSLSPATTNAHLEQALLAIDLFPRAALLLLVFERLRMADAATLLNADPALVRKAQAIGLRELTANLAGTKSAKDKRWRFCAWLPLPAACH
jgi:DNA-directed RNA polymerase specialized sigma24 family protein